MIAPDYVDRSRLRAWHVDTADEETNTVPCVICTVLQRIQHHTQYSCLFFLSDQTTVHTSCVYKYLHGICTVLAVRVLGWLPETMLPLLCQLCTVTIGLCCSRQRGRGGVVLSTTGPLRLHNRLYHDSGSYHHGPVCLVSIMTLCRERGAVRYIRPHVLYRWNPFFNIPLEATCVGLSCRDLLVYRPWGCTVASVLAERNANTALLDSFESELCTANAGRWRM